MKALMGQNQGGSTELQGLANLHTDGEVGKLADSINDFLISVSDCMPRLTKSHDIFQPMEPLTDKYIISIRETESALRKVKVDKAMGPDNVPAWILRDFAHILAGPLTAIFNSSLREGVLPSLWKTATIIPIPKKHPPKTIEKDLRTISLTPIVCKVFESIMLKRVDETLNHKLDTRQFGSISGTCTTDALVEMVHQWYQAMDTNGTIVRILLLDYTKAFDLINHEILISKLKAIGIPPLITRWMAAFLLEKKSELMVLSLNGVSQMVVFHRELCVDQRTS